MIEVKQPPVGGGTDCIEPTDDGLNPQGSVHSEKHTAQILTQDQAKTIEIFDKFIDYKFSISTTGTIESGLTSQEASQQLITAKSIALGDIHGSYEKLVETLITAGLATMPSDKAERFVKISGEFEDLVAKNPHLSEPTVRERAKEMHTQLSELLEAVTWIGGEDRELILLGDLLADRGVTDTLTLQLLNRLSRENPERFIKLTSNHDHCAIHYLLTGEIHQSMLSKTPVSFAESQVRAFKLSDNQDQLRGAYLEHIASLKLMHYDRDSKSLYAHAPIKPENIRFLINELKEFNYLGKDFEYEHVNSDTIQDFVELANQFYKDSVLFPFEYNLKSLNPRVEQLINTDPEGLVWPRTKYQKINELPTLNGAVEIMIHGHASNSRHSSPFSIDFINDKNSPILEDLSDILFSVICLDNEVRKTPGKKTPESNSYLFMIKDTGLRRSPT